MSEIGKFKLALFPDKLDSIIKVSQGCRKYDAMYPVSIELSLTNACNLKCVWCCDSTIRRKYSGYIDKKILFDLFRSLLKGGTKGVTVEGGGEPTLHPDFVEIIHSIRKNKMAIGLFSNGLKIDEVLPNIRCFEWIRISLDADNPATFKKYKGRNCFNTVIKNIKKLAAKKGNTLIGVGYISTRYNMGHIEDLIELLKNIGVDYFYIRPIEDYPEYSSLNDLEWLKAYSSKNFEVVVNYSGRLVAGNSNLPCLGHSITTVISADASVYACGRLHIHESHKALGDLKKNSFHEIWNGRNRIKLTKQLRDLTFINKHCPVCRITKYNEFINELISTKTINFI